VGNIEPLSGFVLRRHFETQEVHRVSNDQTGRLWNVIRLFYIIKLNIIAFFY